MLRRVRRLSNKGHRQVQTSGEGRRPSCQERGSGREREARVEVRSRGGGRGGKGGRERTAKNDDVRIRIRDRSPSRKEGTFLWGRGRAR